MKICKDHWQMMQTAVDERGMSCLIAKDGEAMMANTVRQLEEAQSNGGVVSDETTKETFDPLMSMHWHWCNGAIANGGLYLLGRNPDAEDGEFCPVCEFAKHAKDFDVKREIDAVGDQMRAYCVEQKLIPGAQ